MNIHKNARLTPLRREEMALAVIKGAFPKPSGVEIRGDVEESVRSTP